MEAIKMAAMVAMDNLRNTLRELEYKRESCLDELTKTHCEISYAKADLGRLEIDFKNLSQMDMPVSNNRGECIAAGNGANKTTY